MKPKITINIRPPESEESESSESFSLENIALNKSEMENISENNRGMRRQNIEKLMEFKRNSRVLLSTQEFDHNYLKSGSSNASEPDQNKLCTKTEMLKNLNSLMKHYNEINQMHSDLNFAKEKVMLADYENKELNQKLAELEYKIISNLRVKQQENSCNCILI